MTRVPKIYCSIRFGSVRLKFNFIVIRTLFGCEATQHSTAHLDCISIIWWVSIRFYAKSALKRTVNSAIHPLVSLSLALPLSLCKYVMCMYHDHHQHHLSAHLLHSNPFTANAKQHSMMWIVMNHERFMVLIIDVIVANNRKLSFHTQPPLGSCCCAEQCAMLCSVLNCTVVCIRCFQARFTTACGCSVWQRTSYTHVRLGSLSTTE